MQIVKKIDPTSCGKLFGLMGVITGFIVGFFITLASFFNPDPALVGSMKILSVGAIILFPLLYGLGFLLYGLLGAFFYNIISKKIGGIKVELENTI